MRRSTDGYQPIVLLSTVVRHLKTKVRQKHNRHGASLNPGFLALNNAHGTYLCLGHLSLLQADQRAFISTSKGQQLLVLMNFRL